MNGRIKDMLQVRKRGQVFICAICVFVNEDESVSDAATIINGLAVCVDHAGFVNGGVLDEALTLIRRVKAVEQS